MSYSPAEEFEVLHGLRIKGMTQPDDIVATTGLARPLVDAVLADSVSHERARERTGGRVQGFMLTTAGRDRHAELRANHVPAEQDGLVAAYDAFLVPNQEFKTLTTKWQTEASGDPAIVLAELVAIHEAVNRVLEQASTSLPRMRFYGPRFSMALEAFQGGDSSALAQPMSGSYHDVWMELHEDLLQLLARERTDADG